MSESGMTPEERHQANFLIVEEALHIERIRSERLREALEKIEGIGPCDGGDESRCRVCIASRALTADDELRGEA